MKCRLLLRVFIASGLAILLLSNLRTIQAATSTTTTTTALTVSSGGQAIASGGSVTAGSAVTLTAAVTAGSTNVTTGQVSFCVASASSCTDIHLLGIAQLTSAGTAVLSVTPAIGSHSYKAIFAGTPHGPTAYAASTSSTATFSVTGLYPTFGILTEPDLSVGAYILSADIGGNGPTAPTGAVSFVDSYDNNAVLGTASLSSLDSGPNFLTVSWIPLTWFTMGGQDPAEPIAVGDFNGDGMPDVAGAGGAGNNEGYSWDAAAGVAINQGNGRLFPAATTDLGSSFEAFYVAVGDFNGDGKLDLAVGGYIGQTYLIAILLGNGDGTLTNKGSVAVSGPFQMFAVGDFNGDGIPDLAVAETTAKIVQIFLGNGDGTFTASTAASPTTGDNPDAITVADFNGDGIPDLAIGNDPQGGGSGSLTILLGNGDGTFTAAASPSTPNAVNSIAVADFNGDGKADIAVANGSTLTLLTGNGDGTFASSITPEPGSFGSTMIVVGDFNGDGKADLAFDGYGFLLLGNGDGTFTVETFEVLFPSWDSPATFPITAAADFNGDGVTDLTGPGMSGGETIAVDPVLLASNQTVTGTVTGIFFPPSVGYQDQGVSAIYAGDSVYAPATYAGTELGVSVLPPGVFLTASPISAQVGSSITLTATVNIDTSGTPTGTVTFYVGSTQLGTAALNSSGIATYTTTALPIGSDSLIASYAGGGGVYDVATSTPFIVTIVPPGTAVPTVTVTPSSATITSTQADTVTVSVSGPTGSPTPTGSVTLNPAGYYGFGQQPLASGATSFTIGAGSLGSGANILTATYSGDANYPPATGTTTITVAPLAASIPAPAPVSPGASTTATATLTSGTYAGTLTLTCALTTSPNGVQSPPTCTLNPTSVTLASGGAATSVLTVATTAASTASLLRPDRNILWGFGGGGTVLAILLMCGIPARRRRWLSMMVLLWMAVTAAAIGCGGGGGGGSPKGPSTPATTAGNYTFTITGTDSTTPTITTSTAVAVTVQ